MEFNKENLINNFEYVEKSGVMVFFNPSTVPRSEVEDAVMTSALANELPSGTLLLVSLNGDGRNASLTKVPNTPELLRSFGTVGGGVPPLFRNVISEVKGLGMVDTT